MTSRSRQRRIASGTAALALVLAACSSDGSDEGAAATTTESADAVPETTTASSTAPAGDTTAPTDAASADDTSAPTETVGVAEILQFTAPLVGGGTFDGAAVADKPTAFWFWAPT